MILQQLGIDVLFCWILAHVIEGNEVADKLAKSALNKNKNDIVEISIGREAKSQIHHRIMTSWQEIWNIDTKGRGYYKIQNLSE